MKKFKKYLSQVFYQFGMTVRLNRIETGDFENLRRSLLAFRENDDVYSYSKIINSLTRQDYKRTKFIKTGGAVGSTGTYTVAVKNGEQYFEKIFDKTQIDVPKLKTNYNYLYNELKNASITIPRLVNIYETDLIAICHYEYFQLIPIKDSKPEFLNSIISRFKNILQSDTFVSKPYAEIPLVKKHLSNLLINLQDENLEYFLEIKNFVDKQKKILSHGDFHQKNVFKNCILDWDEAGFYPFGLDLGWILYYDKFYEEDVSIDKLFSLLDNYHLNFEEKIGVGYFFMILSENVLDIPAWISGLYHKLKQNYES